MTSSTWSTRPRDQYEAEVEIMRNNLRSTDWAITLAVLSTIDMAEEPRSLDLICDLVELRAGRAPECALMAWGERARAFLHSLLDRGAKPEHPRVN